MVVGSMRRILLITISLSSSLFGKDQESILPVFRESCVRCHGENGKVKGKLNLLEIASVAELKKDPERLQKIIEAIVAIVAATTARAAMIMLSSASMFMPRAWMTAALNAAVSDASCIRSRCITASPTPQT